MAMRLGDLLVERGVISAEQRDNVLEQQRLAQRPFGLLAEEMLGVAPRAVESAWATQYAQYAEQIDLADACPQHDAMSLIESRQAWQFGVVPVRLEDEELVIATTVDRLPRALRFAGWRVPVQCRFCICTETELSTALEKHYPMAGLNTESMRSLRIALEG